MINTKTKSNSTFISLGFAELAKKGDFDYENFPSKLGGLPVFLITPDVDISYFECENCKKNLYFLLQLYSPLEQNEDSFHRVLYVFFCKDCWKRTNAVKVLRVQLPQKSEFYNQEKLLNRESLENDQFIQQINNKLNKLLPEFIIDSCEELNEASKIYLKFYENVDEKSQGNSSVMDIDEDDLITDDIKDEKVDKMIKDYYNEEGMGFYDDKNNELEDDLESEMINKIQSNIFKNFEDIFYELFSKILSYDPKQIVRFCRDDVMPLWFTQNGMLTMRNTKCKNCQGEMIFEFQIMPQIFNLYKEISNIDIGTLVVYTCRNSCTGKKSYLEEYAYIQRTGEGVIDLGGGNKNSNKQVGNKYGNTSSNNVDTENLNQNLNKLTFKDNSNNEPDEDGWVEIKKKTKK